MNSRHTWVFNIYVYTGQFRKREKIYSFVLYYYNYSVVCVCVRAPRGPVEIKKSVSPATKFPRREKLDVLSLRHPIGKGGGGEESLSFSFFFSTSPIAC